MQEGNGIVGQGCTGLETSDSGVSGIVHVASGGNYISNGGLEGLEGSRSVGSVQDLSMEYVEESRGYKVHVRDQNCISQGKQP